VVGGNSLRAYRKHTAVGADCSHGQCSELRFLAMSL
jgi:hypothetical protein